MTLGVPSQSIIAPMSIAAFATIVSWTAIFLMLPTLRQSALAHPVARSSHRIPTPQGAGTGIAIATAIAASAFFMVSFGEESGFHPHVVILALSLAAMVLTGLLDDIQGLSVRIRLAIQFASAAAIITSLPTEIAVLPEGLPRLVERIIEIGALLTFMNLVNFIDGLDEISIAHGAPAIAGVTIIAVVGSLPGWIMPLSAAALGALIGFWPWNRHVAKIFLGDSGSLPLGLLLGYLMIVLAGTGYWSSAALLCLYPLTDGAWTLFDRWRRGQNLTEGHRDHCYQRATSRGLAVTTVSRTVLALSCILALLAQVLSAHAPLWQHVAMAALGLGLTAVTLRWFATGGARPL